MADWSRAEVAATVSDYLDMLGAELAGVPYNKAVHRRRLVAVLDGRSEQSVEFKHANISAVLIELGFPYIAGYKPRSNYQTLLFEVVAERLGTSPRLLDIAAADADSPMVVPEVDDILAVLTDPPKVPAKQRAASETPSRQSAFSVNYLEREARNRALGAAGEEFVLNFERARLIHLGRGSLAGKIEHTSRVRGDAQGFDILSFDESGAERLIEVKTTKYGRETPFFVSRNEVAVSESRAGLYQLYRLFQFRAAPQLFILGGAIPKTRKLEVTTYMARVE